MGQRFLGSWHGYLGLMASLCLWESGQCYLLMEYLQQPSLPLQVYVLKRPYVDEFLRRMGELFECVLFTASLAKVPERGWEERRGDDDAATTGNPARHPS